MVAMKDAPAIYLGQIVSKNNFRVFIYAPDGSQKLVESWDSYEKHMESGVWFATRDDAQASIAEPEKPKRVRKPAVVKPIEVKDEPVGVLGEIDVEIDSEPEPAQDLAFEVTNDDFLPKTKKAR
jgi:hypothetical protein